MRRRNRQRLSESSPACSGYTPRTAPPERIPAPAAQRDSRHHSGASPLLVVVADIAGVFQVDPPASPSLHGPLPYGAVLLSGTKKRSVSTPSWSKSQSFLSIPPAYPVRLPSAPTTRWQGMRIEMGLWPTAPRPRADMLAGPVGQPTVRASAP